MDSIDIAVTKCSDVLKGLTSEQIKKILAMLAVKFKPAAKRRAKPKQKVLK